MKLTAALVLISTLVLSNNVSAIEHNPTSHSNYVTGGVVGTIFGLGIGQAINGNYGTTGWIFTVTEVVGTGMFWSGIGLGIVGGIFNSVTKGPASGAQTAAAGLGLTIAGALVYTAFRIWDIVDLWETPIIPGASHQLDQPAHKAAAVSFSSFGDGEVSGLSLHF